MNRHITLAAFIAVAFVTAPVAIAQAPASAGAEETVVYVIRDDRGILNSKNADALIRTTIVEPALKLATSTERKLDVKAACKQPPCSAEEIVDTFFDYYRDKFPSTTKRLAQWIRDRNPDVLKTRDAAAGELIVLPCIPVSPQQDRRLSYGSRLVVPCSNTTVGSTATRWETAMAGIAPTSPTDIRREVNETIEQMTLEEYRLAYPTPPQESVVRVVTSLGNYPDREARLMEMRLFGVDPADVDCHETPFRTLWQTRLAGLDGNKIKNDAATRKLGLVLLDWDFAGGHGKKVKAVSDRMLECLKIKDVQARTLDLHPRRNAAALESLVRVKCKNSGVCDSTKETKFANVCARAGQSAAADLKGEEIEYLDALCWIRTANPPDSLQQKVDQYVLQAAFEDILSSGSWINVSFDLPSGRAEAIRQSIAQRPASRSMIFAAAGNSGTVDADSSPQGMAQTHKERIVNITFGTRDGMISGAVSSTDEQKPRSEVVVLAPGTGFRHQNIPPESMGSSFASPWVATAAWVKRLVDATGREAIGQELVRASRPVRRNIFSKVSSGGFFDPYLLLVADTRRVLTADESLSSVVGGNIKYKFFDPESQLEQSTEIKLCGQNDIDYTFFEEGGKIFLWKRSRVAGTVLEIRDPVSIMLQFADQPDETLTLAQFVAKYGEFSTRTACQ